MTPYPLGRVVQHDPRSLAFAHGVLPKSAIGPVAWTRRAPVFDQGSLGSCTGMAATGLLGTDSKARVGLRAATILDYQVSAQSVLQRAVALVVPKDVGRVTVTVQEELAERVYGLATSLDQFDGTWPPDDTGSSGIGAAKALQKLDLATGYTHAFSPDALKSALMTGPVMVGTIWLGSMFETDDDHFIVVDRTSGEAGGHEWIVHQYDPGRYRMTNSWGTGWGEDGMAWIKEDDLHWLLSRDGDVTVPKWNTARPRTVTNQQLYDSQKANWATTQAWGLYKGLRL